MLPVLTATALVVISQLANQTYRPGVNVQFNAPQIVAPRADTEPRSIVTHHVPQRLCTMPLLRPQGKVDPKIVVEPPKNGAKIRAYEVPRCVERTSR